MNEDDKCPRCTSPAPHLHPAVQSGGEVIAYDSRAEALPITVGELRAMLEGVPDDLDVMGEVEFADGDSYVIGAVRSVAVETRCDDKPALYIWTNANESSDDTDDGGQLADLFDEMTKERDAAIARATKAEENLAMAAEWMCADPANAALLLRVLNGPRRAPTAEESAMFARHRNPLERAKRAEALIELTDAATFFGETVAIRERRDIPGFWSVLEWSNGWEYRWNGAVTYWTYDSAVAEAKRLAAVTP